MVAVTFLFEALNRNLLLGFMPEPIGLLVFGVALIGFAVGLRRIFTRNDEANEKEFRGEN